MEPVSPSVRVEPTPVPPPSARLVARLAALLTRSEPPRLFGTIGRNRRLSRWWLPFAGTLLLRPRLPRPDVELLILRTAWNCACWYEWVQHAGLASRAGLSQVEIAAVPEGMQHDRWTPRQRVLLATCDDLHAARTISDGVWAALLAEIDEEEAIELCFLVGHYEMLAMALNSLGVEPEPTARRKLAGATAGVADQLRDALLAGRARVSES
jgi:alkylhydroperoxidase family enzyme